jgi:hypothetical protein
MAGAGKISCFADALIRNAYATIFPTKVQSNLPLFHFATALHIIIILPDS